jgi:hypothetical protein
MLFGHENFISSRLLYDTLERVLILWIFTTDLTNLYATDIEDHERGHYFSLLQYDYQYVSKWGVCTRTQYGSCT